MVESPLVDVLVITYNQENYVADCINSILNQKTSFVFRVIVGDDNSSDNTKIILQSFKDHYPDAIELVLHSKNGGNTSNYRSVYQKATAPYIALCEGDDYWIDNTKLQRQVDFLESHSDYGFIGTNNKILYKGRLKSDPFYSLNSPTVLGQISLLGDVFKDAIYGPVTRTVTICFRRSIISKHLDYISKGDYTLQAVLASRSKFAKIEDECAVYRTDSGVSSKFTKTYNRYYVDNLQALSELFPAEAGRLTDIINYTKLKEAYYYFDYQTARFVTNQIVSEKYRDKKLCRLFHGPLSFMMVAIIFRMKVFFINRVGL